MVQLTVQIVQRSGDVICQPFRTNVAEIRMEVDIIHRDEWIVIHGKRQAKPVAQFLVRIRLQSLVKAFVQHFGSVFSVLRFIHCLVLHEIMDGKKVARFVLRRHERLSGLFVLEELCRGRRAMLFFRFLQRRRLDDDIRMGIDLQRLEVLRRLIEIRPGE